MGDPAWEHTIVLRGAGFQGEVRALKSKPGKDIVTTGSITLVHVVIAAGLVDEYRRFVNAVVLGRGVVRRRDWGPEAAAVETPPFRTGVVLLRYRPT